MHDICLTKKSLLWLVGACLLYHCENNTGYFFHSNEYSRCVMTYIRSFIIIFIVIYVINCYLDIFSINVFSSLYLSIVIIHLICFWITYTTNKYGGSGDFIIYGYGIYRRYDCDILYSLAIKNKINCNMKNIKVVL